MKESFLLRAKENLKAAEILFDQGLYNASANRAYYSAFHLTIVYLYNNGIVPIIDHRNVLSMFISEFVNKRRDFRQVLNKIYMICKVIETTQIIKVE